MRQYPQKRVVAAGAVRIESGFDVQPVRVQIRRVRPVRDVHVTGEATRVDELDRTALEELVEVTEDGSRIRRRRTRRLPPYAPHPGGLDAGVSGGFGLERVALR